MPFQISLLRPPSAISTANCRIFGIFLGFSPSNGRWEPNVGVSKTRAERALLQIVVQSRLFIEISGSIEVVTSKLAEQIQHKFRA